MRPCGGEGAEVSTKVMCGRCASETARLCVCVMWCAALTQETAGGGQDTEFKEASLCATKALLTNAEAASRKG